MNFDDATRNTILFLRSSENASDWQTAGVSFSNFSHIVFFVSLDTGVGEGVTLSIEDSADDSSYAATSVPSIVVGASSGPIVKTFHLDSMALRRYVRLSVTGSTTMVWGVGAFLMNNAQSLGTAPTVKF